MAIDLSKIGETLERVHRSTKYAGTGAPTVYERGGSWWWTDEAWEEHGPCSTKESAQRRQSMYAKYLCEETSFLPTKQSLTSFTVWWEMKNAEKENEVHPCHCPEPWDCECAGACSCHWRRGTE